MSNFKTDYFEKHQVAVQEELGLGNVMEVPRMTKITVNMGLGEALQNSKFPVAEIILPAGDTTTGDDKMMWIM